MNRDDVARRISATELVAERTPEEPAVSPDGATVAFTLSETDLARSEVRHQIWIAPRDDGDASRFGARQLTFDIADASEPSFAPVGERLAFLSFRPQPDESDDDDRTEDGSDKRQVYLVEPGGADARRFTDRDDGVEQFRWTRDGSAIVTLGRAHRPAAELSYRRQREDNLDDALVVNEELPEWEIWLHPFSGKAERLLPPVKGIDSFDISPDGRLIAYSTNRTGRPEDIDRSEIVVRDIETGKEHDLTGGRGGAEASPRFTSDGRFVIFHGWANPKIAFSRQEAIAVRIDAPDEAPRLLLEEIDRDLEEFDVTQDGQVAALVAEGLDSRLLLIDPESRRVRDLDIGRRVLSGLSAAAASPVLGVVVEDASTMPEVARIDAASGESETLTALHPDVAEWRRADRRRVRWMNEGLAHEGLLLTPAGEPGPPPPLVTWIHGGPHWRVLDCLRVYEAEVLAAEGYAVFLPQYRGSSGHGQAYSLASRLDLGGADARDILAGIDHVVAEGLADPERLAVAGASYGGYMTNWLLATTDRFRAGISMAGIFDLAHDWSTSDFASWEVHYLGAPPWSAPDIYRDRSPLGRAASIEAPVLVLHGLDDDNSFFTNSKGLYRALSELGRTTELVLYPREGHGLFEPAHRIDALHRMLDWLGRHVSGAGEGAAVRVAGRAVAGGSIRMLPMGYSVRREYAGVRPAGDRVFLEVSLLVRGAEDGPGFLRLVPCGASADIVLTDESDDLHRPIGVPITLHDSPVLFAGRGAIEARRSEDGLPPSMPVSVVFEIPDLPGIYRLRVYDLPPVTLDVSIEPEGGAGEDDAAAD